jgi:hypothetical protein
MKAHELTTGSRSKAAEYFRPTEEQEELSQEFTVLERLKEGRAVNND